MREVVREEITKIPEGPVIIASGPLTSDALSKAIQEMTHEDYFHFYDAAAPIIEKESIDFSKAYVKSRYDKGEAAYINCPMNKEEFDAFMMLYYMRKQRNCMILIKPSLKVVCRLKKWHAVARKRCFWTDEACRFRKAGW